MLQYLLTRRDKVQIYLATAGTAVAVIVGVFVFQGFSVFGNVIAAVCEERYVQDFSVSDPEILNAAIRVDEATLNQAPKLKEILNEAYKKKDNNIPGSSREYTSQINIFDYNSIKAISEKNPLGAERFLQQDSLVVKSDDHYYGIIIYRR